MLALYVTLSTVFHIPFPMAGNIWFDMGYIVFGLMLALFGPAAAMIGVMGVFIENMLFTGWISYSWMAGQLVIGIACGIAFWKCKKPVIPIIVAIVSGWVGIGLVKTLIEVALGYGVFPVKIVRNSIAAVADIIPLIGGYFLAKMPVIKKLQ